MGLNRHSNTSITSSEVPVYSCLKPGLVLNDSIYLGLAVRICSQVYALGVFNLPPAHPPYTSTLRLALAILSPIPSLSPCFHPGAL